MAALSMHGLLPHEFPREAWNLAVGIWFRLGGTQLADCPHRLFNIPAGQVMGNTVVLPETGEKCRSRLIRIKLVWMRLLTLMCRWLSWSMLVFPVLRCGNYCAFECTGLGGSDLGSPIPWDILVRTGLHHEEVYGPSLARMELAGVVDQATVQCRPGPDQGGT